MKDRGRCHDGVAQGGQSGLQSWRGAVKRTFGGTFHHRYAGPERGGGCLDRPDGARGLPWWWAAEAIIRTVERTRRLGSAQTSLSGGARTERVVFIAVCLSCVGPVCVLLSHEQDVTDYGTATISNLPGPGSPAHDASTNDTNDDGRNRSFASHHGNLLSPRCKRRKTRHSTADSPNKVRREDNSNMLVSPPHNRPPPVNPQRTHC